jgi:hypothetical protein
MADSALAEYKRVANSPGRYCEPGLLSPSLRVAFEQAFDEVRPDAEVRSLQARKFGPQIDKPAFRAPLEDPQRSCYAELAPMGFPAAFRIIDEHSTDTVRERQTDGIPLARVEILKQIVDRAVRHLDPNP